MSGQRANIFSPELITVTPPTTSKQRCLHSDSSWVVNNECIPSASMSTFSVLTSVPWNSLQQIITTEVSIFYCPYTSSLNTPILSPSLSHRYFYTVLQCSCFTRVLPLTPTASTSLLYIFLVTSYSPFLFNDQTISGFFSVFSLYHL